MSPRSLVVLFLVVVATAWSVAAGPSADPYRIDLIEESWTPEPGLVPSERAALDRRVSELRSEGRETIHVLVQLWETPTRGERLALAAGGLELHDAVPHRAYIAAIPLERIDAVVALPEVRWLTPWDGSRKLHPRVRRGDWGDWTVDPERPEWRMAFVQLHHDVPVSQLTDIADRHRAVAMDPVEGLNGATVWLQPEVLDALAAEEDVLWIEEGPMPLSPTNDGARSSMRVDPLYSAPYSLTGDGVRIFVYDGSSVRTTHTTFDDGGGSRVTDIDSTSDSDHPTHVAGTAAGDGNGGRAQGVAIEATVLSAGYEQVSGPMWFWGTAGDIEDDYTTARTGYDADFGTNSIGSNTASYWDCDREGDYGVSSNMLDGIVRGDNTSVGSPVIMTWANGNERGGGSPPGRCGANYLTTAPPSCAKNPIHVGAVNSDGESMTTFSSWGPCDDGRLKPVVSGPGCETNRITSETSIYSSTNGSDTSFGGMCGTSMATPAVAGVVALMVEDWRAQGYGGSSDRPLPALVKAMLIHTARDLGQEGPDFIHGYGAVDATDAIDLVRDGSGLGAGNPAWGTDSVDDGAVDEYTITVPAGAGHLRATLAWDDFAAAAYAANALVNDLDLRIIAPGGVQHQPWVLNDTAGSRHLPATTGNNDLDNQEQVVVENPTAGIWTIRVTGTDVPQGPQSYGLVYSAETAEYDPATCTELIANGDFESDTSGWTLSGASRTAAPDAGHGSWSLRLGGSTSSNHEAYAEVAIPAEATHVELDYWWHMETTEGSSGYGWDSFFGEIRNNSGTTLTVHDRRMDGWVESEWMQQENVDLTDRAGETVRIAFRAENDSSNTTTHWVDDVSVRWCSTTPCDDPSVPTNLTVDDIAPNRVDLSWDAVAGDSYRVYRSENGGPMTMIASGLITETYSDAAVHGGIEYHYTVRAFNSPSCESGDSNQVSVTAIGECTLPPVFGGLTTTTPVAGACAVDLAWSAATAPCGGPVVYNVYRSTTQSDFTPGPTTLHEVCVSDTSFRDAEISAGGSYHYVVRAEDATVGHAGACGGGNTEPNIEYGHATAGVSTFTDDVEAYTGGIGDAEAAGWSHEAVSGTDDWQVSTAANHTTGGTRSFASQDVDSVTDKRLISPSFDLTTSSELTFWHQYDFDPGDDGGLLEISTNGGASWQDLENDITSGGYTHTLSTHPSHPIPGRRAWSGSSGGWTQVTVDLGSYAGADRLIRWRMGCDRRNADGWWYIDDITVTELEGGSCTGTPRAVRVLTATARDDEVLVEWANPSAEYGTTRICWSTSAAPSDPAACGTNQVDVPGPVGGHGMTSLPGVSNDETYHIAAFVNSANPATGQWSGRRTCSARPAADPAAVAWRYSAGATALAPPGVRPGVSALAVANDRTLHGIAAGGTGGAWPGGWMPPVMNAPSQSRPVSIALAIFGSTHVSWVSSQDGRVYCLDADDGSVLWTSEVLGDAVQAGPSGTLVAYGGPDDLIIVGTRNPSGTSTVRGLNALTGEPAWTFDNDGGEEIGIISSKGQVVASDRRFYVTSRRHPTGSQDTVWCLSFTANSVSRAWSRALGDIDASPILRNGVLYVGTVTGQVYALDPDSGADLWGAPWSTLDGGVRGFIWVDTSVSPTRLYVASDTTLTAVNDLGGSATVAWGPVVIDNPSTPLVIGNDVYVGSSENNGSVLRLSKDTGAQLGMTRLGDPSLKKTVGTPAYDWQTGHLIVGTDEGRVYSVAEGF